MADTRLTKDSPLFDVARAVKDSVLQAVRKDMQSFRDDQYSLIGRAVERSVGEEVNQLRRDMETFHGSIQNIVRETLLGMLNSLPSPVVNVAAADLRPMFQVNVPEQAPPTVNVAVPQQLAPTVNVSVPQQAPPTVNVAAAEVHPTFQVNVPEQEAPVVNVSVPQQAAPTVNVTVPEQAPPTVEVKVSPPRLVRKELYYDSLNRPVEIVESEIED